MDEASETEKSRRERHNESLAALDQGQFEHIDPLGSRLEPDGQQPWLHDIKMQDLAEICLNSGHREIESAKLARLDHSNWLFEPIDDELSQGDQLDPALPDTHWQLCTPRQDDRGSAPSSPAHTLSISKSKNFVGSKFKDRHRAVQHDRKRSGSQSAESQNLRKFSQSEPAAGTKIQLLQQNN